MSLDLAIPSPSALAPAIASSRPAAPARRRVSARGRLVADVYAWSRPAGAFTGDLYFFHREGDELRFCLGDVAGKGLASAVLMGMVHELIETRLENAVFPAPAELVSELWQELRAELPLNRFVTLVAGRLDAGGRLEIANAGHCPPALRRRAGSIETLLPTGPILGPLPAPRWTTHVRRLERGDALVLYSDGVLEAAAPNAEEFGLERIEKSLAEAPAAPARAIADRLLADVAAFRGSGGDAGDDTTVMAILV